MIVLSGSVLDFIRRSFNISHFFHFLVSKIISDTECKALSVRIIFDVIVISVCLIIFNFYDIRS